MNILIVDDEENARSLIKDILQQSNLEVDKIFLAESLLSAVKTSQEEAIDLLFLDIEMPGHKGTELFDFIPIEEVDFKIVFTTAYEEFAVKAFEMNAIDYLLKPLRPKKILEVVKKLQSEKEKEQIHEQLKILQSSLMTKTFRKVGLPVSDGVRFVSIDNIIFLEADGMYCKIYMQGKTPELISKPLKHFTDLLSDEKSFIKPHRTFFINLKYLKQYVSKDGGFLIMENDKVIPIARNQKKTILEQLV